MCCGYLWLFLSLEKNIPQIKNVDIFDLLDSYGNTTFKIDLERWINVFLQKKKEGGWEGFFPEIQNSVFTHIKLTTVLLRTSKHRDSGDWGCCVLTFVCKSCDILLPLEKAASCGKSEQLPTPWDFSTHHAAILVFEANREVGVWFTFIS